MRTQLMRMFVGMVRLESASASYGDVFAVAVCFLRVQQLNVRAAFEAASGGSKVELRASTGSIFRSLSKWGRFHPAENVRNLVSQVGKGVAR